MIRWLGVGLLLGTAVCASAAVAQLPISPVYRSGSEQAQPTPDKDAPAKDRAPAMGDNRENAPPAKPAAAEPQPVATAPIPPPLQPDANDGGAAAETRSRPAPGPSEQTPKEKTQKGQTPAATAATPPPLPPAPASRESATDQPPSRATESAVKQDQKAAPETAPVTSRETKTEKSEAGSRNGTKKDRVQSERRQTRTARHAHRRGTVYYSWPYYARSFRAYPDRTRGYGGGLYGPSPYSSEGP